MHQLSAFDTPRTKPINVSAVKHRSPFRYPGGKTWFVPRIFQWLTRRETKPQEFIEPFAGGGIVGLSVAFENLADHVILAELDNQVAAVWKIIIENGDSEWLAIQIEKFDITEENVLRVLNSPASTLRDQAFQTILQNRVSHGGILAKGAGLLKYGEGGKGIKSRWYPQTLAKRIRDIHSIKDRLSFIQRDAFEIIEASSKREDVVYFLDPPYTAGKGKRAGTRLYNHFEINHERLFALLEQVKGEFVLTYDNDEYVRDLATKHAFQYAQIAMNNTHHAEMKELVIARDLSWLHQRQ